MEEAPRSSLISPGSAERPRRGYDRRFPGRSDGCDRYLKALEWPAEADAGEEPPELSETLAGQIDWNGAEPDDRDNRLDANGSPIQTESGVTIGSACEAMTKLFWIESGTPCPARSDRPGGGA